jgi:hypothetical protein
MSSLRVVPYDEEFGVGGEVMLDCTSHHLPDLDDIALVGMATHALITRRQKYRLGQGDRMFRRTLGVTSALALSISLAGGSAAGLSRNLRAVPRGDRCSTQPRAVSPSRVPTEVKLWTHGSPVIGNGSLWALRPATELTAVKLPDGTYSMKFPWYLYPQAQATPTITGRRLDGPGMFRYDTNVAFDGSRVFATSSLKFSALGCWQVTGHYRGSSVTFRLQVRPNPATG